MEARTLEALALAPSPENLDPFKRKAARHLWSTLYHLEHIAVIAARMGAGIDNQLEDELMHREVFRRLGEQYGGLYPPGPEIQSMISYIGALRGPIATVAVNLVGEHWLEAVFRNLANPGFASEMFALIEADEHRHAHDALSIPVPPIEQLNAVLPALERKLYESAMSPAYLAPLTFTRGEESVWRMGLEATEAHSRACEHMGTAPSACVHRLGILCRTMLRHGRRLQPLAVNKWRVSISRLDTRPAVIGGYVSIPVPERATHMAIEARIIRALYRTIAERPELNRVYRAGQFYAPPRVKIGSRRRHDDNQVMTVYATGLDGLSVRQVQALYGRKARKQGRIEYESVPELGDLADILPPSAAVAVVSYCGAPEAEDAGECQGSGVECGWTALLPAEGVPCSLGIGEPQWKLKHAPGEPLAFHRVVVVGVSLDHIVFDGRHLSLLCNGLKRNARIESDAGGPDD